MGERKSQRKKKRARTHTNKFNNIQTKLGANEKEKGIENIFRVICNLSSGPYIVWKRERATARPKENS